MRTNSTLLIAGMSSCIALLGCERSVPRTAAGAVSFDPTRPNVVLISVDMLRPDHLGCYGYARGTSPRIDQLAAEGALFETAISSSSWTLPAHAALMTGLLDSAHGCVDTNRRLGDEHTTLAERLRAVGYETAGFHSGPYLHSVFGFSQGFDSYVDCSSYAELNANTARRTGTVEGLRVCQAAHRDVTSPTVYHAVRDWLHRGHDRPFFLFVHLWDVHYDFIPPPPYDQMFDPDYTGPISGSGFLFNQWINARMPQRDLDHLLALYDGEIAWTDKHIGMMLDDLDACGLRDSTIVVLVADHGTEFFEHGDKSHRQSLFDEVIRIPMLIRYPGQVPAGLRIETQVSIIDVLPTVVEMARVSAAPDVMGQSLLPLVDGQAPARDNLAISELFSNGRRMRSFRRPDRKLIQDFTTGCTWIYDLRNDPGELQPLFAPTDAVVEAARRDEQLGESWLAAFVNGSAAASEVQQPTDQRSAVPERVLEQLKSLGYVGSGEE